MVLITRSLLALVAIFSLGATATHTVPTVIDSRGLGGLAKGPLALLGGPEGLAISLILDTKPGQEAEAYLEKEAEKAAQPVTDYLESEAKKHAKSELDYFTSLTQQFKSGKGPSAKRSLLKGIVKGPLALLGGPEGIAISLLLDTKPGQEAEAYLEKEAEKAAQPVTDYLESEAKKHGKSELQYFTEITQKFGGSKTRRATPAERRSLLKGIAKGPLALLGGPEGIAISLLLDTKPGQEAEAYLEKEAEKAAQPVTDYLESEAKKHGKSELQYFTEISQKFH